MAELSGGHINRLGVAFWTNLKNKSSSALMDEERFRPYKLLLISIFHPSAYRALRDYEQNPNEETFKALEKEIERIKAKRSR